MPSCTFRFWHIQSSSHICITSGLQVAEYYHCFKITVFLGLKNFFLFNKVRFADRCHNSFDERECSDNGDCINSICLCDSGFSGSNLLYLKLKLLAKKYTVNV